MGIFRRRQQYGWQNLPTSRHGDAQLLQDRISSCHRAVNDLTGYSRKVGDMNLMLRDAQYALNGGNFAEAHRILGDIQPILRKAQRRRG